MDAEFFRTVEELRMPIMGAEVLRMVSPQHEFAKLFTGEIVNVEG